MPLRDPQERFIHNAGVAMLSLVVFASACAAIIPWLGPVRQPLDLIIPPVACTVFTCLLIQLLRRPASVRVIIHIALLTALLALAAPAWFYTLQATLTPGLQLIAIYPPVASLLLALMVMVMIFLPGKQAWYAAVLGWLLVALPVLVYLFDHPQEMHSPRGADLLMTYGPVVILVVVVLPVQRGLTRKIQRLVAEQAQMEIMVNRDPLTRIYNRRFSEQVLQNLLQQKISAGVIMFDMDHFKAINDTYGHPVGDRVLEHVARCCQPLLREGDCLARWGGEEFLIAVPNVDASGLEIMTERLRSAIANLSVEPVQKISAAVGVAVIERDDDLAKLLQRVDQALYRAKQLGGNRVSW